MSERPATDRILIERIAVFAHHGVLPEEARLGGRFLISLDVELDLSEAGRTDNLDLTVSYAELAALAVGIATTRRFALIEAMAEAIAAEALARYPRIRALTVRIDKPGAPIPAIVGNVAVVLRRARDG